MNWMISKCELCALCSDVEQLRELPRLMTGSTLMLRYFMTLGRVLTAVIDWNWIGSLTSDIRCRIICPY